MSAMTTAAPRAASAREMAAPIPDPPPVTIAALPAKASWVRSPLGGTFLTSPSLRLRVDRNAGPEIRASYASTRLRTPRQRGTQPADRGRERMLGWSAIPHDKGGASLVPFAGVANQPVGRI